MRKGVRHLFSTWGHVKNQRLTPTGITFLRNDPDWRPYYIPLQTRLTKRHSGQNPSSDDFHFARFQGLGRYPHPFYRSVAKPNALSLQVWTKYPLVGLGDVSSNPAAFFLLTFAGNATSGNGSFAGNDTNSGHGLRGNLIKRVKLGRKNPIASVNWKHSESARIE